LIVQTIVFKLCSSNE